MMDPTSITTRSTPSEEAAGRVCETLFHALQQILLRGEVPSPALTTHTPNLVPAFRVGDHKFDPLEGKVNLV